MVANKYPDSMNCNIMIIWVCWLVTNKSEEEKLLTGKATAGLVLQGAFSINFSGATEKKLLILRM